MKNTKFLTILIVLMLSLALVFVSCEKTGDETTAPEVTNAPATDAPTEPAEETTAAPETTAEEATKAPETTKAEETTEAPHTHSFSTWNTVKAASCSEEGSAERTCSCGAKETQAIAKTAHRDGEWVIDKEATATADGSKHLECAVCKATLKTEVIPATPHTPGEWIVDKEATCTEKGARHRVCTKCGETTDTEEISAKGHKEVADKAKDATCTESGLTAGSHCSVCNTVLKAQESVPAKGHTEEINASCAPTCTASGLTEGKTCKVCREVLVAQQTVPATGHKAGEWIIDKEATTSSAGSKHLACLVCGETIKTEQIPMIEIVKKEFTVTVVDGFGAPMSGVEVFFMSGDKEAAKATTDKSGKASAMLVSGDYKVVVESSDGSSASYDVNDASPSIEAQFVALAQNPEMVYPGATETDNVLAGVYTVSLGSVRVPVEKGKIRYLFFIPTEGAIYHIYTDSDKVEVGYYGGSFFVSPTNIGFVDENGVLIHEFLHSSVGSKVVLGLTSTSASVDECTLTIVKAADIEIKDVERPWEQFVPTQVPKDRVETPAGTMKYVPIEINFSTMQGTQKIEVVYNEKDGYYHLHTADGPVLYVKITQSTQYLDPLSTIVQLTNIGKSFYDENGNLVKKESYVDAIFIDPYLYPDNKNPYYSAVADKKYGVVPLNEELIYILKHVGEDDWYKKGSPDYIFDNSTIPADVIPQNAWLFACVYFE